ncbi:response regulator [Alteromonas sp. 009811495]|uniref:response regulator n=1 Tax=Alteromonas sp. 009811495 TaxID=3002962 RepID=UPI00237E2A6F|nr:response regulator [Alteromonas sp. 009811495]WDT85337.1 response regulator [Alteromonas sp. 009811495]
MLSVAVVEDDQITLDLIVEALETQLDATVHPFSRSKFARDFILQQTNDTLQLIISDQVMPDYDGLSLLKTCHAARLDIPFLLITADPSKALVVEAKALQVAGFLAKPLDMTELVFKSKEALARTTSAI